MIFGAKLPNFWTVIGSPEIWEAIDAGHRRALTEAMMQMYGIT